MTNDLISRHDLMQFPIRIDSYDKKNGNEHFVLGIESVLEFAKYLPSVDAVEVVRCCDCIHHRVPVKDECGAIQFLYCYHPLQEEGELMLRVDFTDYCSYGKRRESEVRE